MKKPKEMWKTSIEIWTNFDPPSSAIEELTSNELICRAFGGKAVGSTGKTFLVKDCEKDPDWELVQMALDLESAFRKADQN